MFRADQLTYRAIRDPVGWVLSKHVTGAALKSGAAIAEPTKTLRDARVAAVADSRVGCCDGQTDDVPIWLARSIRDCGEIHTPTAVPCEATCEYPQAP